MRALAVEVAALVLIPLVSAGSGAAGVNVEVDVNTVYTINGVDRIQGSVLGVTAYEGAPWPAMDGWREVIAQSGISCLGFPAGVVTPPELRKMTPEQIEAWYASPAALGEITDGVLNGRVYLYGRILPACRKLNIEPMMYLFGILDIRKPWTRTVSGSGRPAESSMAGQ